MPGELGCLMAHKEDLVPVSHIRCPLIPSTFGFCFPKRRLPKVDGGSASTCGRERNRSISPGRCRLNTRHARAMGRHKDAVWTEYDRDESGKCCRAVCHHCGKSMTAIPQRMRTHVARCTACPAARKEAFVTPNTAGWVVFRVCLPASMLDR